jgi:hypothetical protein
MIVNVVASLLGTGLIARFAWSRRRAWLERDFTHDDRLVLLFALVLLANGAISYPYTKDVVMSPAGAFFAVALFAASRHTLAHGSWRGFRIPAAVALALALSVSWSIRYIGLHAQLRDTAEQVRDEWALADAWMARQYGTEVLGDPAVRRLKQQLQDEAVLVRPALRPRLPRNEWTRLLN